jgi:hypothetical protein
VICHERLGRADAAIAHFDHALDDYFAGGTQPSVAEQPSCLKAFADIDQILTARRDWKAQERSYRQMIKRLPTGHPLLPELWHNLGEIYRTRLRSPQGAIAAFEVAACLEPRHRARHQILAELYANEPGALDKAAVQRTLLLATDAFNPEHYQALSKLYGDARQIDRAYCVAAALVFLQRADPSQQMLYTRCRPRSSVPAQRSLGAAGWATVQHAEENRGTSAIFRTIAPGLALASAMPAKGLSGGAGEWALADAQALFTRMFEYVGQVLELPPPLVRFDPHAPGDLSLVNTKQRGQACPMLVLHADLLGPRSSQELTYAIARAMTFLRPEYYLRLVLPSRGELLAALLAAATFVQPNVPVPPDLVRSVRAAQAVLRGQLGPLEREQISIALERFTPDLSPAGVDRWVAAVDATSRRVGLLLCADLEVAARGALTEPTGGAASTRDDRVRDLLVYSVSPDHFRARKHLGIAID